jgi:hypothetical protein
MIPIPRTRKFRVIALVILIHVIWWTHFEANDLDAQAMEAQFQYVIASSLFDNVENVVYIQIVSVDGNYRAEIRPQRLMAYNLYCGTSAVHHPERTPYCCTHQRTHYTDWNTC